MKQGQEDVKNPKILILSASTGNGHMSAAFAIEAEAKMHGLSAEVIDVLDFSPPGFTTWYRGGYEKLVKDNPKVWGHLYRSSDRPLFNYSFQTWLDYVFTKQIRKKISEFKPDWILCTHSLPQPRLVPLRREFGFKIGIVVTDLYVHRMWLRGRPDFYFVPQEWSRKVLLQRLPKLGHNSEVTGIPIHPIFREGGVQRNWTGKLTALVSSGGIGGGPLIEAVEVLRKHGWAIKAIAGRNSEVQKLLSSYFENDQMVEVYGQVNQEVMASFMKSSHLLVSKPGGLTTFESLATGIPFMVYWPFLIPGQEEGNAQFLKDCGAGLIARSSQELHELVGQLTPDKLMEMSELSLAHGLPNASTKIIQTLRNL